MITLRVNPVVVHNSVKEDKPLDQRKGQIGAKHGDFRQFFWQLFSDAANAS